MRSTKRHSCIRSLKRKGFKEETVIKIGWDDLAPSTTLEANKSRDRNATSAKTECAMMFHSLLTTHLRVPGSHRFCRGLLRTNICPFRHRWPFFAETRPFESSDCRRQCPRLGREKNRNFKGICWLRRCPISVTPQLMPTSNPLSYTFLGGWAKNPNVKDL